MAWLVILNGNNLIERIELKELLMGAVQDVIDQITEQLDKAKTEILTKVADLETQVAAGETPDLEPLKAAAQGLDDIVVDKPDTPDESS
jgi:hypothetical protein